MEKTHQFIFRIRNNFYVTNPEKGRVQVSALMVNIKHNETKQIKVIISGIPVLLAATRSITGELVIVVASRVKGKILKHFKARFVLAQRMRQGRRRYL